jgi:protein O-GlcNAc transferase
MSENSAAAVGAAPVPTPPPSDRATTFPRTDPRRLIERGTACLLSGAPAVAVDCFIAALALNQDSAQALYLLAVAQLQAARPADARQTALRLIGCAPKIAPHHYVLGRACEALGDWHGAIEHYRSAADLDPRNLQMLLLLGDAHRAAGQRPEAAEAYWRMTDIDPVSHEAHLSLGNLLLSGIARREATASQAAEAALGAGQSALGAGRHGDALSAFVRSARLAPGWAQAHYHIALALSALEAPEQALVHYDIAARLWPEGFAVLEKAGTLAASLGLAERARGYFGAARRLRATDALALRLALTLPAIEESTHSIEQTRARFDAAVEQLHASQLRIPSPFPAAQLPLFYLAYHGHCNRQINSKVAQLCLRACPDLAWTAPHTREPRTRGRIKIGFVSHYLREHSIGKTSEGLIAHLPREQFEIFTIDLYPGSHDERSRRIHAYADQVVSVPAQLESARRQIAELKLDVLFYQDIGLEPLSYFLAYARLAAVQCVSFGHPDTSGIPNVDYFISNDLYELPGTAAHYSERLFLLRDLPTLAYYSRPAVPPETADRARFGLSAQEHIYLCPQMLFKLHPSFDVLMAEILRRDPRGRILLIRQHCEQWCGRLKQRFESNIPDVADRISFMARVGQDDFLQLLRVADVVLDTTHFNGMNSSLEAFAVAAPVVTLPTGLQRGRHTQAMYQRMGIGDCVARDAESYVEIATQIAMNADLSHDLRLRLAERTGVLYENDAVIREFSRFFSSAVRAACF